MKKIVLAALLASGLMAADSGFYVGADRGNTAVELKSTGIAQEALKMMVVLKLLRLVII